MVDLVTCKNKENQSKIKEQEWSQDFPHYNHMGAICCHGNQSSDFLAQNLMQPIPHPNDAQMKFDYDQPAGFRDIHF